MYEVSFVETLHVKNNKLANLKEKQVKFMTTSPVNGKVFWPLKKLSTIRINTHLLNGNVVSYLEKQR